MAHHHHHDTGGKNLGITILLNIGITVAQVIGGIISGSMALLSDAAHNFSDVLALIISWIAKKLTGKEQTISRTFGYKRAIGISCNAFDTRRISPINVHFQTGQHPKFILHGIRAELGNRREITRKGIPDQSAGCCQSNRIKFLFYLSEKLSIYLHQIRF